MRLQLRSSLIALLWFFADTTLSSSAFLRKLAPNFQPLRIRRQATNGCVKDGTTTAGIKIGTFCLPFSLPTTSSWGQIGLILNDKLATNIGIGAVPAGGGLGVPGFGFFPSLASFGNGFIPSAYPGAGYGTAGWPGASMPPQAQTSGQPQLNAVSSGPLGSLSPSSEGPASQDLNTAVPAEAQTPKLEESPSLVAAAEPSGYQNALDDGRADYDVSLAPLGVLT